jgi:hypothetical protein
VDAHSAEIREMAVNIVQTTQIASGGILCLLHLYALLISSGFDQKLCVLDLQGSARVVNSTQLGATIGSVKWPTCNQGEIQCAPSMTVSGQVCV